jgi:hypothetical protein
MFNVKILASFDRVTSKLVDKNKARDKMQIPIGTNRRETLLVLELSFAIPAENLDDSLGKVDLTDRALPLPGCCTTSQR